MPRSSAQEESPVPGPLRLLFVIPWRDRGKWLWEHLPAGFTGDLAFAAPEPENPLGRLLRFPYLQEIVCLAQRRPRWDNYDVIFTWELRSALATSILCRWSRQKKAHWVVVGPILKGGILKALPIVRWLLRDADRIVCFSRAECADYARLLRLPPDRFSFLPTPWLSEEEVSDVDGGFILALGQSNRDYPTLIEAVRDIDLPLTIVAGDPFALGGAALPPHVCVRYNTGHHETIDLIARATLHCIPLHNADYSAGQTVLLRAMARGKAVVVTDTAGIRDYVRDSETAVLVPPGDPHALRAALLRLWSDAAQRQRIGTQAAQAVRDEFGFEQFTQRLAEFAISISHQYRRENEG